MKMSSMTSLYEYEIKKVIEREFHNTLQNLIFQKDQSDHASIVNSKNPINFLKYYSNAKIKHNSTDIREISCRDQPSFQLRHSLPTLHDSHKDQQPSPNQHFKATILENFLGLSGQRLPQK